MTEPPMAERPGGGTGRLRMDSYVPAPDEQVLHLSVASSLFPQLPLRSRNVFRVGLAFLFLSLIVLGALRWQAPMIAVSALGLPLIFLVYLYETGIDRSLTLRVLAPTALLGIGFGVGWALATGSFVADFYDVSLANASSRRLAQLVGIAVPVGGAILMLVPAAVMRLVQRTRKPLDGLTIGSLSAISFTAAATLARMAPQFATGVTAGDRPITVMLAQAGVQGIAIPLMTAAMGGLVGAALWFGRWKPVAYCVLATLALFAAVGLWEATPAVEGIDFGAHLMFAVVALLTLRIGLQYFLLHQGYEVPDSDQHTTHRRLLASLGAGLSVVVAAGITAAVLATPPTVRYTCPPDCGRPPIGQPIDTNPRFVAKDGEFSVQYPAPGSLYKATMYDDWVALEYLGGDTGVLDLWGEPAEKRTARQVVEAMIAEYYPDATLDYEIPNAMVGYEPGYGAVFDDYPQDTSGSFTRLRIVAIAAVKGDYALVATAVGPYHEFTPTFGTGHPSGVNLALALDMGKYVNSFRWRDGLSG